MIVNLREIELEGQISYARSSRILIDHHRNLPALISNIGRHHVSLLPAKQIELRAADFQSNNSQLR